MKVMELFDLTGKTSIVTGGYQGLGMQAAMALAEAGSNIVLCARNLDKCIVAAQKIEEQENVQTKALKCDVSNEEDVEVMVEEIVNKFGRIDILVNNAGITWGDLAENMSLDKWEKVLKINMTGTFLVTQKVGRQMIKQKKGKIINISSLSALRGLDYLNAVSYASSKGGVISFTKDIAVNWAPYNINANVICPGFFNTEMIERFFKIEGKKDKVLSRTPLKRIGGENDLKGLIVLLASAASDFITGSVIEVDGGYSAS